MGEVEAGGASISPSPKRPRHILESEPQSPSKTTSIFTNVAIITPESEESKFPPYTRSDSFSSHSSSGSSQRIEELRSERNVKLGILVERLRTSKSDLSHSVSPKREFALHSSSSSPDLKARADASQKPVEREEESLVEPSKLERIRAKRQRRLYETQQQINDISSKMHTVSSVPNLEEHKRDSIPSPSSDGSEDIDKLQQRGFEPTNTDRLRSQHQKIIDDIQKQLKSFPESTPTKSTKENEGLRSRPASRENGGLRGFKNRLGRLSSRQQESQRHLNSLLKQHGYFETPKMQELRKKRDKAQQHMLTMVGRSRDCSPECLDRNDWKRQGSSDGTFENLSKLDQLRRKRAQSYDKAQLELSSFGDSSRDSKPSKQASGESSAPRQTEPTEEEQTKLQDGALEKTAHEVQGNHSERRRAPQKRSRTELSGSTRQIEKSQRVMGDGQPKESDLCNIIDDLQHQVEKLKEEQSSQKVCLERELHDSRMEAELFKGKYEESHHHLNQLKEEYASMETRHDRQQVRFDSTTQLWRHRADGLLEQVRESHLALQDQTQMRMLERIDFIRHIALLERENHELKHGEQGMERATKARRSPYRSSFFSFLLTPFSNMFRFGALETSKANNSLLAWHPMKATPKYNRRKSSSCTLRGIAQRGGALFSFDMLKGAAWGFGFMGLILMADPSHKSPESSLFLRVELPVQSFMRR